MFRTGLLHFTMLIVLGDRQTWSNAVVELSVRATQIQRWKSIVMLQSRPLTHSLRFLTQSLSVLCSSPTPSHQKYDFAKLIRFLFYLSVMGRVSPVPNHTFHTYRFLYTEGFLRAAFQFLRTFHGFHPYAQGSASLCSLFRDLSNDTAEFTLCYGLHNCSPLLPRLLYPLA